MNIFPRKARPITAPALEEARTMYPASRAGGRNVVVFCAATTPKNDAYARDARELGALIGERGNNLVWGATDAGIMKVIATAAKARKARLLGVSFAGARDGGRASRADVLFGASDIVQRKDAMLYLADVAIAMPGGIGTIDEIATVLERKKGGDVLPPLVLLNTEGFFDGVIKQIHEMHAEGLLLDQVDDLVRVADTPKAAIELAETLQPVDRTFFLPDDDSGWWV
jgi:uncharacterized protein (TIGR00730 family)